MALQEVKIWASNTFRYRKYGSRSWTTLRGGEWYTLSFAEGERIEFSSTSTVDQIKIRGAVELINIENSELTTLADAFTNDTELKEVIINSSVPITDITNAFKNTGIITLTMSTSSIVNANNAFEDTGSIQNLSIEADNLKNTDSMFENSSIKTIDSLTGFKATNAKEMFKNANELKNIGNALDLTNANEDTLKSNFIPVDSDIVNEFDILISRQHVALRKRYTKDINNIINDSYNFEMDISSKEVYTHNPIRDIQDELDQTINDNYNFEFEAKKKNRDLPATKREDFNINTNLSQLADIDNSSLELDISIKNNTLNKTERNTFDVDTKLDESLNDTDNTLEVDISIKNNSLNKTERQQFDINTNLDESFDLTNNTLEIDISTKNKILNKTERYNYNVNTELDESVDLTNNTLELDLRALNNKLNKTERSQYNVYTGLDTTSDLTNYTLEIDIAPISEVVDPFDDDSCIFRLGRHNHCDLVSGDIFEEPVNGNDKFYYMQKFKRWIYSPHGGYWANTTDDQDYRDNCYKNTYIRFHLKTTSFGNNTNFTIYNFKMKDDNSTKFEFRLHFNDSSTYVVQVCGRDNDSDAFTIFKESDNLKSRISNGEREFSVALIDDPDNADKRFLLIDGVKQGGSFTLKFTDALPDGEKISYQDYLARDQHNTIATDAHMVFNRALSQSEIQYLDTI
jgi:hypothetical protein